MSRCVKCGNIDGIRTPYTICENCSKSGNAESVNLDLKDPKGKLITEILAGNIFIEKNYDREQRIVFMIAYDCKDRLKIIRNKSIEQCFKEMSEYLESDCELTGRWLWKAYGTFVTIIRADDKIVEFKDDQNNQWKYFKADFLERFVKQ